MAPGNNVIVADGFAHSISFEVEAVPQDNTLNLISTASSTPLKVKIKVRKKKDTPSHSRIQNAVVSIPKYTRLGSKPNRIRLASSDQTIMSFDISMEDEENAMERPIKKSFLRKFKPGRCFESSADKDDYQYVKSATTRSRSENELAKKPDADKSEYGYGSGNNSNSGVLGNCKPGGCLDPPFGEDKYAYELVQQTPGPGQEILTNKINQEHTSENTETPLFDKNKLISEDCKTVPVQIIKPIPQDDKLQSTSTTKSAPLNANDKVQIDKEMSARNDSTQDRVRSASSDQTIMSMKDHDEKKLSQTSGRLYQIKNIFRSGNSLSKTVEDQQDVVDTKASSKLENAQTPSEPRKSKEKKAKKGVFGKYKPGGCLDPDFQDEFDKTEAIIAHRSNTMVPDDNAVDITTITTIKKDSKVANVTQRKSDVNLQEPKTKYNKGPKDSASILNIFQSTKINESFSSSIITYPPALTSSEMQIHDENNLKNNRINLNDRYRKSFQESQEIYFPKKANTDRKTFNPNGDIISIPSTSKLPVTRTSYSYLRAFNATTSTSVGQTTIEISVASTSEDLLERTLTNFDITVENTRSTISSHKTSTDSLKKKLSNQSISMISPPVLNNGNMNQFAIAKENKPSTKSSIPNESRSYDYERKNADITKSPHYNTDDQSTNKVNEERHDNLVKPNDLSKKLVDMNNYFDQYKDSDSLVTTKESDVMIERGLITALNEQENQYLTKYDGSDAYKVSNKTIESINAEKNTEDTPLTLSSHSTEPHKGKLDLPKQIKNESRSRLISFDQEYQKTTIVIEDVKSTVEIRSNVETPVMRNSSDLLHKSKYVLPKKRDISHLNKLSDLPIINNSNEPFKETVTNTIITDNNTETVDSVPFVQQKGQNQDFSKPFIENKNNKHLSLRTYSESPYQESNSQNITDSGFTNSEHHKKNIADADENIFNFSANIHSDLHVTRSITSSVKSGEKVDKKNPILISSFHSNHETNSINEMKYAYKKIPKVKAKINVEENVEMAKKLSEISILDSNRKLHESENEKDTKMEDRKPQISHFNNNSDDSSSNVIYEVDKLNALNKINGTPAHQSSLTTGTHYPTIQDTEKEGIVKESMEYEQHQGNYVGDTTTQEREFNGVNNGSIRTKNNLQELLQDDTNIPKSQHSFSTSTHYPPIQNRNIVKESMEYEQHKENHVGDPTAQERGFNDVSNASIRTKHNLQELLQDDKKKPSKSQLSFSKGYSPIKNVEKQGNVKESIEYTQHKENYVGDPTAQERELNDVNNSSIRTKNNLQEFSQDDTNISSKSQLSFTTVTHYSPIQNVKREGIVKDSMAYERQKENHVGDRSDQEREFNNVNNASIQTKNNLQDDTSITSKSELSVDNIHEFQDFNNPERVSQVSGDLDYGNDLQNMKEHTKQLIVVDNVDGFKNTDDLRKFSSNFDNTQYLKDRRTQVSTDLDYGDDLQNLKEITQPFFVDDLRNNSRDLDDTQYLKEQQLESNRDSYIKEGFSEVSKIKPVKIEDADQQPKLTFSEEEQHLQKDYDNEKYTLQSEKMKVSNDFRYLPITEKQLENPDYSQFENSHLKESKNLDQTEFSQVPKEQEEISLYAPISITSKDSNYMGVSDVFKEQQEHVPDSIDRVDNLQTSEDFQKRKKGHDSSDFLKISSGSRRGAENSVNNIDRPISPVSDANNRKYSKGGSDKNHPYLAISPSNKNISLESSQPFMNYDGEILGDESNLDFQENHKPIIGILKKVEDYSQHQSGNIDSEESPSEQQAKRIEKRSEPSDSVKQRCLNENEVIVVDVAFQSFVNKQGELVIKSVDAATIPNRQTDDGIITMNSKIRPETGMSASIDGNNYMTLTVSKRQMNTVIPVTQNGIKKVNEKQPKAQAQLGSETVKLQNEAKMTTNNLHLSDATSQASDFTTVKRTLSDMYELQLVPLQKVIRSLRYEIDQLAKQQEVMRQRLGRKTLKIQRMTNFGKRCGCLKKSL